MLLTSKHLTYKHVNKQRKMPVSQIAENNAFNESSKTFVFMGEGHTLGNALRCVIANNPDVEFCGYTVPHPAESKMHFRIQMHRGRALDALKKGVEDLINVCNISMEKLDEELLAYSTKQNLTT